MNLRVGAVKALVSQTIISQSNNLTDGLIGFNDISTRPWLFYALGNRVYDSVCIYIFT